MTKLTRVSASVAVGVVLAVAGSGAAAQAADRSGWVAGRYSSYSSCVDAGKRGVARHDWRRFDCDRTGDNGRNGRHDRHDRHRDADWLLRVSR